MKKWESVLLQNLFTRSHQLSKCSVWHYHWPSRLWTSLIFVRVLSHIRYSFFDPSHWNCNIWNTLPIFVNIQIILCFLVVSCLPPEFWREICRFAQVFHWKTLVGKDFSSLKSLILSQLLSGKARHFFKLSFTISEHVCPHSFENIFLVNALFVKIVSQTTCNFLWQLEALQQSGKTQPNFHSFRHSRSLKKW